VHCSLIRVQLSDKENRSECGQTSAPADDLYFSNEFRAIIIQGVSNYVCLMHMRIMYGLLLYVFSNIS